MPSSPSNTPAQKVQASVSHAEAEQKSANFENRIIVSCATTMQTVDNQKQGQMMKTTLTLVLAAAAACAISGTAQAGKCVVAGGEATMVTEDLAKFMASAALKNSIAAHSWKPSGTVTLKCDTGAVGLAHCVAHQKACG
jgi:hypothetical protein